MSSLRRPLAMTGGRSVEAAVGVVRAARRRSYAWALRLSARGLERLAGDVDPVPGGSVVLVVGLLYSLCKIRPGSTAGERLLEVSYAGKP